MIRDHVSSDAAMRPPTVDDATSIATHYTVSQAATLLEVSQGTVWRWIRAGRLPAARLGPRATRIAHSDLQQVRAHIGRPDSRVLNGAARRRAGIGTADILAGDHVTQFYDDDAFLLTSASDFIGAALRRDEVAIVVATAAHRAGIEQRLQADGFDLARARHEQRYVTLDAAETLARFLVDGTPDMTRFLATVGSIIARAAEGGRRVAVFGEMVALRAMDGDHAGAIHLEGCWNTLQRMHPFTLFCAYPLQSFAGREREAHFESVCARHTRVIPAEGFAALIDPDERLREIARLQQKARSLEAEIAERKSAEAAVARTQQEHDDFIENAVVGLHRVGPDGRILWANRAELTLLGYSYDEYVGRPIADFHADQATIEDILRRLSAGEELHSYPARLRCKDGSIKHVLISSNVRWEDGRFVHTRCFTRDITDLVRAEQGRELLSRAGEVLASSLEWDVTLDHVIDLAMPMLADFGFFDVIEPNGQVRRIARAYQDSRRQAMLAATTWVPANHTDLNLCALTSGQTGYHPDITDDWLHHAAAGPEHLAVMRDLAFCSMVSVPLSAGERVLGALTLFYADSRRRHAADDVAVIEDLARRAAMAVENARLYGEAREAIRARDEFLSIASHELRNPVAGLKVAAQMLRRSERRGQLDAERLTRYVETIEQTANRLASLTEDLLDVSRLQQGVLPLRRQPTDLAALLSTVAARQQTSTTVHRLVTDIGSASVPVLVDPDRIEQIMDNLLSNAIKYAPEGGDIQISIANEGGGVIICVQDTGIGLPPGIEERIFQPFGRAHNAVERNIQGLGLGLYICRQIAEQHGGRLWAESAGESLGTTMRLWLPASEHDAFDGSHVST